MDVGAKYAGTLSGSMNMRAHRAAIAPLVIGIILDSSGRKLGAHILDLRIIYSSAASGWLGWTRSHRLKVKNLIIVRAIRLLQ